MPSRKEIDRKYTVSSLNTTEEERIRFILEHFDENKAFSSQAYSMYCHSYDQW